MAVKTSRALRSLISTRPLLNFSAGSCKRYSVRIDSLPTRYGGKTNITVLPGSGIGPEVMEKTLEILKAADAPLSYEILTFSSEDSEEAAREFENVLTAIKRNKVALKGNIEIFSKNPHVKSRNVLLRKTLDLFAFVLPCKTYPGLKNRFGDIDVIVIRQNTEGEYMMLEHEPLPGAVESLKIITRYASERLAKFAFDYAEQNKRRLITVAHSASVLKESESLFVKAAVDTSKHYPGIELKILEVGVIASSIVLNPRDFDIILTTNLNGSMISNVINGMLGGPGLSAGTNFGENGLAVFEPGARNKGSGIVGKGIANPVPMIKAGINLLNYLGYRKTAQILEHSVYTTLVTDKVLTKDLGGKATTKEITQNVIRHVRSQLAPEVHSVARYSQNLWKKYCQVPDDYDPAKKG